MIMIMIMMMMMLLMMMMTTTMTMTMTILMMVLCAAEVRTADGSACFCGPINGKSLAMVRFPGQVDDAALVGGVRWSTISVVGGVRYGKGALQTYSSTAPLPTGGEGFSSTRKVFSSGAAAHGPGGMSPLLIGSMLVPLPGYRPSAVNLSRGTVRQDRYSRFVEVLRGGGCGGVGEVAGLGMCVGGAGGLDLLRGYNEEVGHWWGPVEDFANVIGVGGQLRAGHHRRLVKQFPPFHSVCGSLF